MNVVTSFFVVRALQAMSLAQSEVPRALNAADVSSASKWRDVLDRAPAHVVERQLEYEECVVRTVDAVATNRVLLVVQDAASLGLLKDRVIPRISEAKRSKLLPVLFSRAPEQPLYSDLFAASRMLLQPAVPTMVCNSDIYIPADFNGARVAELFEEQLSVRPEQPLCLALTRYESERPGDAPLIADYRGSHDAFVFRPRDLKPDFIASVAHPQNCYKAENIVIHELQRAGFAVRNPCLSVRIIHHHAADVRQWLPPVDEERYGRAYPEV